MSEEETVLAYFPKDFDTLLTVRNHYGIEPLILFVKNALKIGSSKLIKDKVCNDTTISLPSFFFFNVYGGES